MIFWRKRTLGLGAFVVDLSILISFESVDASSLPSGQEGLYSKGGVLDSAPFGVLREQAGNMIIGTALVGHHAN